MATRQWVTSQGEQVNETESQREYVTQNGSQVNEKLSSSPPAEGPNMLTLLGVG